jgi:hypothetical protein
MILSGGLGSSAYIRDRLQQQFRALPHPNAQNISVIPCQDPTLVIIRGLLQDRQQRLETGVHSVLTNRVARASYGLLVRQLYNPAVHFNEDIETDRFQKKVKWVRKQIHWLIKKGQSIDVPISHQFDFHLAMNEPTRSWDAEIVVSHYESHQLPTSFKQGMIFSLKPQPGPR